VKNNNGKKQKRTEKRKRKIFFHPMISKKTKAWRKHNFPIFRKFFDISVVKNERSHPDGIASRFTLHASLKFFY
jgi:hypothetical protein